MKLVFSVPRFLHPQFQSDVTKPMLIDQIADHNVPRVVEGSGQRCSVFVACIFHGSALSIFTLVCSDVFVSCFIHRKACEEKNTGKFPVSSVGQKKQAKSRINCSSTVWYLLVGSFFTRQDTWWAFQPTVDHAKLCKRKWSNYA